MYTIEILSDTAFDNLSEEVTRGSFIGDSLGFADPETGRAYVRYAHFPELQQYLVDHELDELESSESAHTDENGIRHKKFRQVAANIGQFALPVLGGAFGGPIGAGLGGAAGGALKAGIGGEKRTFEGVPGAALRGGAMGAGASALTSGFGVPGSNVGKGIVTSAGEGVRTSGMNLGQRFMQGVGSGFGAGNIIPNVKKAFGGFFGGPAQAATATPGAGTVGGGMPSPTPSPTGALTGGATMPTAGAKALTQAATTSQAPSLLNKAQGFFKGNPLVGAGLATAGASQLFKSPQVPELPASVGQFQAQAGQPAPGQAQLQQLLNQPFEQVSDEEREAVLRQFERDEENAIENLQDMYRNLQPGVDFTSSTTYKRDLSDLQQKFAESKADATAQLRRQVRTDFNTQRLNQILASANIDQAQLGQMLQAAQFDVDRVVAQFNIDDRDKETLRNYLLEFGGNLVATGINPQPQGILERFLTG